MTENTSMIPAGYNGAEESGLAQRNSAAAGAGARAELEAMCAMARMNPRDEFKALTAMVNAAKRPAFAEAATYSFPRGGQNVTGPSVSLMRPLATYWGHVRFGVRIVDDDDEIIGIEGFAHDLQTGAYCTLPDRFKKLVQRKNKASGKTEWMRPDERDLRELVNRRGAILVRNCVLSVIPPDIVDRVLQECEKTLNEGAAGKLKSTKEDTIRNLVLAWADFGVTAEDLEKYLGHPLAQLTPQEFVNFQGMYRSIRDGNTKVIDHFTREPAKPAETPTATIDLAKAKAGVAVDPPGGQTFPKKDGPAPIAPIDPKEFPTAGTDSKAAAEKAADARSKQ